MQVHVGLQRLDLVKSLGVDATCRPECDVEPALPRHRSDEAYAYHEAHLVAIGNDGDWPERCDHCRESIVELTDKGRLAGKCLVDLVVLARVLLIAVHESIAAAWTDPERSVRQAGSSLRRGRLSERVIDDFGDALRAMRGCPCGVDMAEQLAPMRGRKRVKGRRRALRPVQGACNVPRR